ncbi:molybdate-binding protein [Curtobacterium sp. Leaf183]|uniref:molybdate ABC transporter substrate-binding protein n=1 Tax=Curtobacterium sp. Leaf183 TaxID=1736291 RepID=UPI0006FF2383|nr:molybdate ABC transporter substrate-binding protein [Curtobacterium sp. Leaf183]KQS14713.1 molybdate-binding protein [Curtobacterium sp. Leaf183]
MRRTSAIVTAVVAAALLSGCRTQGGTDNSGGASTTPGASATPTGAITVFAAASLQQTFTTLGKDYEASHPGATVIFSFAGSSDLVSQIQNGAPADVFASADEANMTKLTDAGLITGGTPAFATNTLQIAVAPGNPKGILDLRDLTAPGLQVVTCAAPVPCGAATQTVEQASGVTLQPVSEEQSVTDVLGKVESGQADAGLVYVTDVTGADGKVDGVDFDAAAKAVNTYPIGVVTGSEHAALAASFSAYVRSSAGEQVLRGAGFGKP